ncbi:hypothetical protein ACFL6G_01480 [candidate division KSB1 bacterium]
MALEVNFIPNTDYLLVNVSGIYDMPGTVDEFALVISTCRKKNHNKVLIDYRQLDGDIAATEKMIYTMKIIDLLKTHYKSGGQQLFIAFLGKIPQISTFEPGADLADQEGWPYILTKDIDEALSWLKECV